MSSNVDTLNFTIGALLGVVTFWLIVLALHSLDKRAK